jgi:hypothetical protein
VPVRKLNQIIFSKVLPFTRSVLEPSVPVVRHSAGQSTSLFTAQTHAGALTPDCVPVNFWWENGGDVRIRYGKRGYLPGLVDKGWLVTSVYRKVTSVRPRFALILHRFT